MTKEEEKLYKKQWRLNPNPRYEETKRTAKRRGIPFDLSFVDFVKFWKQDCHYCGDPIQTIGLDRIDSRIGYVVDNLLPCCAFCNQFKRRWNYESFVARCIKIGKHLQ
jgi:hypothetical protein